VKGRGPGERVRVPVGMSDKSPEGEKQGTGGGCVESSRGYDGGKVGTCEKAQTVGKIVRLK